MSPVRFVAFTAAAAVTAVALCAAPATAAVYTLDLTGDLSAATSNTFFFGADQLTQASVPLSGFTPFTLTSGDVINFSVAFTGFLFGQAPTDYFLIPAATAGPFGQLFGINFFRADGIEPVNASAVGNAVPGGPVGDQTGVSYAGACSNCLTPIMGRAPGPFASFGFHSLTGDNTVTLDGSYIVDAINLTYQVQTGQVAAAVPEPTSWALFVAGFGAIGAATRRNRRVAVVLA